MLRRELGDTGSDDLGGFFVEIIHFSAQISHQPGLALTVGRVHRLSLSHNLQDIEDNGVDRDQSQDNQTRNHSHKDDIIRRRALGVAFGVRRVTEQQ